MANLTRRELLQRYHASSSLLVRITNTNPLPIRIGRCLLKDGEQEIVDLRNLSTLEVGCTLGFVDAGTVAAEVIESVPLVLYNHAQGFYEAGGRGPIAMMTEDQVRKEWEEVYLTKNKRIVLVKNVSIGGPPVRFLYPYTNDPPYQLYFGKDVEVDLSKLGEVSMETLARLMRAGILRVSSSVPPDIKCECGAAATGSAPRGAGHSHWCPVYEEPDEG
jgi:hypothetical protein